MPKITLIHKDLTYEIESNDIIYDSLEEQGEILPHGCLSGTCGSCRLEIVEGSENLKPPSPIEQNTIDSILDYLKENKGLEYVKDRVLRLACRARVLGDVKTKPFK